MNGQRQPDIFWFPLSRANEFTRRKITCLYMHANVTSRPKAPPQTPTAFASLKEAVENFKSVAYLAGLPGYDIEIEFLPAPHQPPRRLPPGKSAVYIFVYQARTLKVGKVGPNSAARYTSQHYNPGSAPSTLAGSLLAHGEEKLGVEGLTQANVGAWIKANTDRYNLLLPKACPARLRTLLEAFIQCKMNPLFER